ADVAYTLQVGRKVFKHRKMLVCSTIEGAIEALSDPDSGKIKTFLAREDMQAAVFLFPGQGAQYVNMGLDLYRAEPVFREEMDRCFEILKSLTGYDIKEILYPGKSPLERGGAENINQTEFTQPLVFIIEYALAKLLMKWGIIPTAMMGHSIGEYAAACIAGVFSLEDALKLVVLRGRLMQKMPPGAMLSVSLSEEQLKPLIELKSNEKVSLAAVNSSGHCVVSGPHAAVDAYGRQLKEKGYNCRPLHTSHAFHSEVMDPVISEFESEVSKITLNEPQIPYISNLTGRWPAPGEVSSARYWAQQLRRTVRFGDGLNELFKMDNTLFLEVGPGNTLTTFVKHHAAARENGEKSDLRAINLLRHSREDVPDDYYLLSKIGEMWFYGKHIDWSGFYTEEKRYLVALPTYPFERRRYPIEINFSKAGQGISFNASPADRFDEPEREQAGSPGFLHQRPELSTRYTAPGDETEQRLAGIFGELFGIETVGIHDDFFELGGDSLKAVGLEARIRKESGVEIPLTEIFKNPTIKALGEYIKSAAQTWHVSIEKTEKKEYYPLSSTQHRFYILQQMERESTTYNMPSIMLLEGNLDKERFEKTFIKLIKRHDSLRLSFEIIGTEPVQRVQNDIEFKVRYHDAEAMDKREHEAIVTRFIRPFRLEHAPLFRVGLIKTGEEKYVLIVDIHHIISDGTSVSLLIKEFMAFYGGEELPGLPTRYIDFAQWQYDRLHSGALQEQETFWLKQFEGELPVLNMPTDYPRPSIQSFEGDTIAFKLEKEPAQRLNELAKSRGATLYMVLLAVYNTLLSKYTGQKDIIIGSTTAGRHNADLENVIGLLIETLAMRNCLTEEQSFGSFLDAVKENTLKVYENQSYPFRELMKRVANESDRSHNPLFDAMLMVQNRERVELEIENLKLAPKPTATGRVAKVDLTITAAENAGGIIFNLEYCTKLFKKETMERFSRHFLNIIDDVTGNPEILPADIDMLSIEEKKQLLNQFNGAKVSFSPSFTIHQLIEEQAEKTPGHIAVTGAMSLSYKELNEKSNRLARVLMEKGIQPDDIVGIKIEPSVEMMVGILGILKSGGAYMPIEPDYPEERINYMVKDSGAKILLTARDVGNVS
ncbi:MAG: acyltransferase domain-containing protein, partial [bacterium]|nr:acyltransferase domain-containing protein [bacterium]